MPDQKEDIMQKFVELAEADFNASGAYLNAPYRICHKGIYYKGRLDSISITEGVNQVKVGKSYRLTIEIPAVQLANIHLRDVRN